MSRGVFLVTGGSRGIGAAVARAAGARGYHVLLGYADDAAAADRVVAAIAAAGGHATAIRTDTGDAAAIARLFAAADRIGPLAVLVCNAGITGGASTLADADPATIARVIDVNLLGAMLCAREAVLRLATSRGGTGGAIVFVSSRAAVYGSPGMHVWYAASKGALDSLTIGLAREVAADGIRVNAVSPGPIDTGMLNPAQRAAVATRSPMARAGTADEAASAILYLACDAAAYVTGANLSVSGGL